MTNQTKIITAIITLIVLAGAGYGYKKVNTPSDEKTIEIGNGINTKMGVTGQGNFKVEAVPFSETVKAPSLDKPITYPADMNETARKMMAEKISTLISAIKKDSTTSLENWLKLAVDRKIIGDYAGAVEIWEYVATLSPKDPIAFGNLGEMYEYYLKDYPKAEKNWLATLKLKPDYLYGYRALAELYASLYTEKAYLAPKILEQGLSKNPHSNELMAILADYWKKMGDKSKAIYYYQMALSEVKLQNNQSLIDAINKEIDALK